MLTIEITLDFDFCFCFSFGLDTERKCLRIVLFEMFFVVSIALGAVICYLVIYSKVFVKLKSFFRCFS